MITFIESSHTYLAEIDGTSISVPSVSSILTEMLGLDYAKINPFYADRGTAVHKAIELTHEDNLDESSVDEEVKPFLDGYFDFLEKIIVLQVDLNHSILNKIHNREVFLVQV